MLIATVCSSPGVLHKRNANFDSLPLVSYEGVNYRKFTAGALNREGRIRVQNGYNAPLYYCAYRVGRRYIARLEPGEGSSLTIRSQPQMRIDI
ncbi:hypothetical protein Pst134EA_030173 [Puccinia striiformis f. sp. tritici]|uniref:hypothetical protein n=1 Tax=Puccinia striiformis f. sp. tritici TaxID=168172 RepID=UPI00200897F3|nr:hypothetical protein Pst134EA_030173 [Puccinia striiformis f. sp. tritici]KAH9446251.1 hypothetical protein Pst134EA_030173 [Puccinia striiformis f. sp. tritici]